VAEDEAMNRTLLVKILQRNGIDAVAVETGAEAIEKLNSMAFSLLFIDLSLPHVDGVDVIRQLRLDVENPNAKIPVFILSGKTSDQMIAECEGVHVDEFVEKPFSPSLIKEIIGKYS